MWLGQTFTSHLDFSCTRAPRDAVENKDLKQRGRGDTRMAYRKSIFWFSHAQNFPSPSSLPVLLSVEFVTSWEDPNGRSFFSVWSLFSLWLSRYTRNLTKQTIFTMYSQTQRPNSSDSSLTWRILVTFRLQMNFNASSEDRFRRSAIKFCLRNGKSRVIH